MKDKKVIRSNQHVFTQGKSCLIPLISFCNEITGLLDEGRVVGIVYLDFHEAFDTASDKILMEKLMQYRLDEQKVRWTENWRESSKGLLREFYQHVHCLKVRASWLWSLHHCRYSTVILTWSWAACFRWSCLSGEVGQDDCQRSLPTSAILWVCDLCRVFISDVKTD